MTAVTTRQGIVAGEAWSSADGRLTRRVIAPIRDHADVVSAVSFLDQDGAERICDVRTWWTWVAAWKAAPCRVPGMRAGGATMTTAALDTLLTDLEDFLATRGYHRGSDDVARWRAYELAKDWLAVKLLEDPAWIRAVHFVTGYLDL